MIREIAGRWWFCCPRCGKKLNPLQAGAVCRGVLAQCRAARYGWEGEMVVEPGDWPLERPNLPA
jgi:hypothetical protein